MTVAEFAVPNAEAPVVRCEYCGHPFPSQDRLVLHKGVEHSARIDDEETEAFLAARSAEDDELRMLLLKASGAIILLYFSLLFMYAIVT